VAILNIFSTVRKVSETKLHKIFGAIPLILNEAELGSVAITISGNQTQI